MLHRATRRLLPSTTRTLTRAAGIGPCSIVVGSRGAHQQIQGAALLSSLGASTRGQQQQRGGQQSNAWLLAALGAAAAVGTVASSCNAKQQQGGNEGGSRRRCYVWGDVRWLLGPEAVPPSSPLPLPIEGDDDVESIAFGPSFAVILLASGEAMWASAATHTQGLMPLAVPDPKNDPAVEAACTADRIYIRTQAGHVYHWPIARLIRRSLSGEARRRLTSNIKTRHRSVTAVSVMSSKNGGGGGASLLPPSEYATLVGDGSAAAAPDGHVPIASIAAGHKHLLLVTADGVLLAAGSNAQGQLGLPGDVTLEEPREVPFFLHLQTTRGLTPVQAVAGHSHSFVVCKGRGGQSQELYAFGADRWLQLGLGEAWAERGGPIVRRPHKVTTLPPGPVQAIAAGGDHSLFLVGHHAYAAGHGQFGQLGTGARIHVGGPVKVLAPHRKMGPIAALAAGRDHSLLLTAGSDPWVAGWGRNRMRQAHYACAAADSKGDLLQPTILPLLLDPHIPASAVVRGVMAGYDSSAVVVEEGAYHGDGSEGDDLDEEIEDAGEEEAESARHDEEAQ